jgi:hypothetical protein
MAERDAPGSAYERLLGAMQRIVQDPHAPESIERDGRHWFLHAAALDEADAAAMAGLPAHRLLLYRELSRNGISSAIRKQIPRTASRLGSLFADYASRFCSEELPRSHYVRDMAFEFVAWVAPRWEVDDAVPAYLFDLARHELCAFEVAGARIQDEAPGGADLSLDSALTFDASTRLMRYRYAVHLLAADEDARDEPKAEPTALLAYRDDEHEVRYLELTPLAAALIARLLDGRTLRQAVVDACAETGHSLDDSVLSSSAELLSDLARRGVLRAARAAVAT